MNVTTIKYYDVNGILIKEKQHIGEKDTHKIGDKIKIFHNQDFKNREVLIEGIVKQTYKATEKGYKTGMVQRRTEQKYIIDIEKINGEEIRKWN